MSQRKLEITAVLMMWLFMLLIAVSFHGTTTSIQILAKFADETNIYLDQGVFATGAFVSTLILPLLLLPSLRTARSFGKRCLFIFSGFPLAAYTVPLGFYALSASSASIGVLLSIWIFLFMCLTGFAVYRPAERK